MISVSYTHLVSSEVKEGYTSPPKAFTEDTLLSSMETAGAAETTDEAERKGCLLYTSVSEVLSSVLHIVLLFQGFPVPSFPFQAFVLRCV